MFISWLQEKYLHYYRLSDRQRLLQEHYEKFERKEASIIALLKQSAFYHGTGAYHYTFEGGSKYDGGEARTTYTLPNILTEGLVPQKDLFNKPFRTGTTHSLSLTKNRIYARGYASLFHEEGTSTQYDYGPRLFWVMPIATRIVLGSLWGRILQILATDREVVKSYRGHYKTMLKRWSHSFRKDGKFEGSFFRSLWASSDIPGNFGVVIGIKHDVINPIPINYPNIGKDEIRTKQILKPEHFSHIQVPLAQMEIVQKELQLVGIDVPVVPLEYVALHEHKVGFRKLLYFSRRKHKLSIA